MTSPARNAPDAKVSINQVDIDDITNVHTADSQSPLYDRYAWAILEYFLTSPTTTFSDTLAKMTDYLGDAFIVEEWAEATTALFSGDEDDALSLQNFRVVRAKYLSDRPSSGGDQVRRHSLCCPNQH
jgi:hypothetical protein